MGKLHMMFLLDSSRQLQIYQQRMEKSLKEAEEQMRDLESAFQVKKRHLYGQLHEKKRVLGEERDALGKKKKLIREQMKESVAASNAARNDYIKLLGERGDLIQKYPGKRIISTSRLCFQMLSPPAENSKVIWDRYQTSISDARLRAHNIELACIRIRTNTIKEIQAMNKVEMSLFKAVRKMEMKIVHLKQEQADMVGTIQESIDGLKTNLIEVEKEKARAETNLSGNK